MTVLHLYLAFPSIDPHIDKFAAILCEKLQDHKQKNYSCEKPIITSKKLFLKAEQTIIGDVTIEGKFSDERGQFWNYSLEGKNVVQAKVNILKKGKSIYSATKLFKYWSGE